MSDRKKKEKEMTQRTNNVHEEAIQLWKDGRAGLKLQVQGCIYEFYTYNLKFDNHPIINFDTTECSSSKKIDSFEIPEIHSFERLIQTGKLCFDKRTPALLELEQFGRKIEQFNYQPNTMKFCKNLQQIVEISDPEWAPYWTNYRMLKVSSCRWRCHRETCCPTASEPQRCNVVFSTAYLVHTCSFSHHVLHVLIP